MDEDDEFGEGETGDAVFPSKMKIAASQHSHLSLSSGVEVNKRTKSPRRAIKQVTDTAHVDDDPIFTHRIYVPAQLSNHKVAPAVIVSGWMLRWCA